MEAAEEVAEVDVSSVIEVGMCPQTSEDEAATVADGRVAEFTSRTNGVYAEELVDEKLSGWRRWCGVCGEPGSCQCLGRSR